MLRFYGEIPILNGKFLFKKKSISLKKTHQEFVLKKNKHLKKKNVMNLFCIVSRHTCFKPNRCLVCIRHHLALTAEKRPVGHLDGMVSRMDKIPNNRLGWLKPYE